MFNPASLGTYTVVEGEARNVSLRAVANPPEIEYNWSFPPSVVVATSASTGYSERGGYLSGRVRQFKDTVTFTEARRSDSGTYTVTASNSYGDFRTTVSINLDVHYPPT